MLDAGCWIADGGGKASFNHETHEILEKWWMGGGVTFLWQGSFGEGEDQGVLYGTPGVAGGLFMGFHGSELKDGGTDLA